MSNAAAATAPIRTVFGARSRIAIKNSIAITEIVAGHDQRAESNPEPVRSCPTLSTNPRMTASFAIAVKRNNAASPKRLTRMSHFHKTARRGDAEKGRRGDAERGGRGEKCRAAMV